MIARIGLSEARYRQFLAYGGSLAAMLVVPAVQFFLFAFYARVLGAEQYGIYIALMAWSPICLELVGMGAGEVLIKHVARDGSRFAGAAGHFYAALLVTLPFALALYVGATMLLVRGELSVWTVLIVGVCELVGLRLFIGSESFAIAGQKIRWANEFRLMQAPPRFVGVGLAYLLGARGVGPLAVGGSLGILVGGILSLALALRRFPRPEGGIRAAMFSEGVWFAGNQLARAGQQNVDRIVLGWLVDPRLLAVYGAAQRFVQVGILPIQAILRMTYPKFFAYGHQSIGSALRYGVKVLLLVTAVVSLCAAVLWSAAIFLPAALGHQFAQSASFLRWIAPSLVLIGINYVAADILTGSDHQRLRTALMLTSVAIQAAFFALFHRGDQLVFAVYAGIGFAALSNWIAVLTLASRERRGLTLATA